MFGATVEKMASDMHLAGYLAEKLSSGQKGEFGELDKEFCNMLKDLIVAFDDLVKVSTREKSETEEIRKAFEQVEIKADIFFRKADVLCKDRFRGPFIGLIHRINDALKAYGFYR